MYNRNQYVAFTLFILLSSIYTEESFGFVQILDFRFFDRFTRFGKAIGLFLEYLSLFVCLYVRGKNFTASVARELIDRI